MTVEYQKVWSTMNDLEAVTSKICSAREIIDSAIDRIQEHEYDKAEMMMSAAYEFLEYYLQEFDDKFKLAWQATVGDLRNDDIRKDPFSCDKDDPSPECKGAWNSFWEENYYPEEYKQYTDEELNAMCDKAELDAEVERIRQEGGYEWTPNSEVSRNDPNRLYYENGWIYESPDDGKTITKRKPGSFEKIVVKKDVVKKWILPVEEVKDVDVDETEYFVSFPDDLLETANLKEGDQIEWVDNKNGTYTIRKVHSLVYHPV